MKSTITRNLQIGFGLSLLLLITSSVASYVSITNLLKSSRLVNHTNEVIQELENVISTLKDAETGQRGFLLTGEPEFLEPYNGAYEKAISYLNRVKTLTVDNPDQQKGYQQLNNIILKRIVRLKENIDRRKAGTPIVTAELRQGKIYMDDAREVVKRMQASEQRLLNDRTADMKQFAALTPMMIIMAAILAVFITIYFYFRVMGDFKQRVRLQLALQEKDVEISHRINIIQGIAEKISEGDYKTRVNDDEKDGLGSLALSLNRMAESLDYSFTLLSDKEWLQTGIAKLNETMVGEKDIETLASDIMDSVASYTESQVGTLYVIQNRDTLRLAGSYAFVNDGTRESIPLGQGLAGQCAASEKEILLTDIPAGSISISFAAVEVKPTNMIAFPIYHESYIKGVIELGSVDAFTERDREYFRSISANVGVAIQSAQNRRRMQELLEETQSQSEELQAQHSEMENINTELETQTQKLQASEEELRVQQEELLQANQELEERSRLLEEKNQVIVERNLDIQRKAEELELSTKYKSEFLANMSHELRTPLNSILLLSRMLSENQDETLNDEQVESARVIQNSGKSLLSLIDEILDLSKIEAGKMDLEYTEVSVEEVVQDMKSLFAPIAREKNLELLLELPVGLPETFSTDKLRLEQILKNLLSNALKFTTKGSVSLEIQSRENAPGWIEFAVKDTGLGIPKEKQALIFEAFQQADGSTRRQFGGTGLGLSISRELAKLLGGEIRLKSEPGEGSEFTVRIPTARPDEGAAPGPAEPEISQAMSGEAQPVTRFIATDIPQEIPDDRNAINRTDQVILIIEDDTIFAKALLDYTHQRGYKGVIAVRGDQGLEMAQHYKPLAILLDIQLPVKDGWQVMEELKSNPKTRHVPVHIMSSMEVKKESMVKGAVDFINKPVAIEQMQQIFQKLEEALNKGPRKVLIVEENPKHAKALAYFLETFNINAEIKGSVNEGVNALQTNEVDCVILDMGIPDQNAYETLETVKKNPGLEDLPIIIFTGKNLSKAEENKIKQYADSIVVKTAHSYQRILDEVALFLHLLEENVNTKTAGGIKKPGGLHDVLKNKTVLIADDDVRNIFSLTKALEQHKMKVVSATDGKEALRQLEAHPEVDIVLMDMMMPEMDGYESTTQIRQHPRFKNIPVLAVTAKAMVGDREKCIRAGASDYISKPVDIDQLISLLRVWLYDKSL
ncbi:response regulator [Hufsiella ginkgonis]|uniref:histidine kinase n=1 Tax=Hufsiella ginkgonis TaxID=2695274 RepID=A0A7K1XSP4_9SPHI|nr:response regulator [Hufsiella ginkgonis]MXV13930.1 response regulator [Hufsiella ginkgonis]